MQMKYFWMTAVAGIAATATGPFASAATVDFTTPTRLADDGSNLDNTGTPLWAYNFSTNPPRSGTFSGTNPDPNVTLNGVLFTPLAGNTASTTDFTSNAAVIDNNRPSGVTSAAAIFGLVYDISTTSANGTDYVMTLQNLTPGESYRYQVVLSASDAARSMTVRSGGADSPAFTYGTTNGPMLVAGEFTADAATQVFTFDAPAGTSQRGSLAAVTLHQVPEPSSAALLLSAGLLGLRRRRRSEA